MVLQLFAYFKLQPQGSGCSMKKIDRYKILGLENNRFISFSNNQGVKLLFTHLLFTMMVSWYSLSYIQIFRSTVCLSTHTGTSMALAMAWMEIWVNKDKIVDKTTEKKYNLEKDTKYQWLFHTYTVRERIRKGDQKLCIHSPWNMGLPYNFQFGGGKWSQLSGCHKPHLHAVQCPIILHLTDCKIGGVL